MFFKNDFAFLSNFYICEISYKGLIYSSAEAAFQAQKEHNDFFKAPYQYMNPAEAKRAGDSVTRDDWDKIKDQIMYEVVKAKMEQNEGMIEMLVAIEGPIVKENNLNDTYWGVCNGVGQNKLGKILEKIRQEYKDGYGKKKK